MKYISSPLIPQAWPADLVGNEKEGKANSAHKFFKQTVKGVSQGREEQASREHTWVLNPVKFFYELSKQLKVSSHVDGGYVLLTSSSNGSHDMRLPKSLTSVCLQASRDPGKNSTIFSTLMASFLPSLGHSMPS